MKGFSFNGGIFKKSHRIGGGGGVTPMLPQPPPLWETLVSVSFQMILKCKFWLNLVQLYRNLFQVFWIWNPIDTWWMIIVVIFYESS